MTVRWAVGVLLAGLLVSAVPACAGQTTSSASVSVAENGYGSQSIVMLHAVLRAGTCGEEGSQLSIQASTRAGVAFTNYTPAGGLVVGIRDKADVSQATLRFHLSDIFSAKMPVSSISYSGSRRVRRRFSATK